MFTLSARAFHRYLEPSAHAHEVECGPYPVSIPTICTCEGRWRTCPVRMREWLFHQLPVSGSENKPIILKIKGRQDTF